LGSSLTARTNHATRNVYRIYNSDQNNAGNNSYAIDTMRIERGGYNAINITPINPDTETANVGSTQRHGITVSQSTLRTPGFWRDTLNFSSILWDFSTVAGRGYPILRGVGGQ
jgi:hypothetical protein